jgi:dolichol kinase
MVPVQRPTAHRGEHVTAVALDVHVLLTQLQKPRIAQPDWARRMLEQCRDLSARVREARESDTPRRKTAREAMDRLSASLSAYAAELAERPTVARMKQFAHRLSVDYEELRAELKTEWAAFPVADGTRPLRLPPLKPVTWARSVFHGATGLLGVLMYQFVLTQSQALAIMGCLAATAVVLEVTRRLSRRWNRFLIERVFGLVARPWERHRTNSATYYTIALTLVVLVMPKVAAQVGVLALAFGDPAASLAGRKWGRRKLRGDKSLVGTLAFVAAAFLSVTGFLLLFAPEVGLWARLGMAATVAIVGAGVEVVGDRLDDNFTIPVVSSAVAALWLFLL